MADKEAAARIKINKLLEAAGWRFFPEGNKPANICLEPSVTLKSSELNAFGDNFEKAGKGFIDFLLLDDNGFPYAVLEAKSEGKEPLNGKEQARNYAISQKVRFIILSNGNLHYFWDLEKGNPTIITSLKAATKKGNNRYLFEMATGTGKTLLSAAVIKLFLRTENAKRVLFLVDRLELEDQAHKNFARYLKNDYTSVIYKENRDDWRKDEIVVTTIQSLSFNNKYRTLFSPTDFDLIISDEAHRSISRDSIMFCIWCPPGPRYFGVFFGAGRMTVRLE